MISNDTEVTIKSRNYWFKVVEFLQTNWALIEDKTDGAIVWFVGDTSGLFDQMIFPSIEGAVEGLLRNGFKHYANNQEAQGFLHPPRAPFHKQAHPNGPIYSSGCFWR